MGRSGWAFREMPRRVAKLVRQTNLWSHPLLAVAAPFHHTLYSVEPKVLVDLAGACSPRRCHGLSILATEVGGNAPAKHAAGQRT